jgi:hypothetical protein
MSIEDINAWMNYKFSMQEDDEEDEDDWEEWDDEEDEG